MATNPRQKEAAGAPQDRGQHSDAADCDAIEASPSGIQRRSLTDSAHKNSNGKLDEFFTLSQRIPIQIFNEETRLQKLSHWGPMVTAVASLVLTAFVWVNTEQLTKRQIDLQARQLDLQNQQIRMESEQAEAELLADMRFKFLADLTTADQSKKNSAEIALAQHGLKAFPVVHYALGVEQRDIRNSAVNVVYRLFQAETNAGRDELMRRLMEEFRSPNKMLHTGIVQSFVKIEPLLNADQRRTVIDFLHQNVAPQNACSDNDGREAVFEGAKFVGAKRGDAIPYLLTVANVPRCGDGWLQAMYTLLTFVPDMTPKERSGLREKIEQIKKDVLEHLDRTIIEQDLAEGAGFTGFLSHGEVGLTFETFKARLRKEFDALIAQLG